MLDFGGVNIQSFYFSVGFRSLFQRLQNLKKYLLKSQSSRMSRDLKTDDVEMFSWAWREMSPKLVHSTKPLHRLETPWKIMLLRVAGNVYESLGYRIWIGEEILNSHDIRSIEHRPQLKSDSDCASRSDAHHLETIHNPRRKQTHGKKTALFVGFIGKAAWLWVPFLFG